MAGSSPHSPTAAALPHCAHASVGYNMKQGLFQGLAQGEGLFGFFLFVINPVQTIPASLWEFQPRMNSIISLESLANADHLLFISTLQHTQPPQHPSLCIITASSNLQGIITWQSSSVCN